MSFSQTGFDGRTGGAVIAGYDSRTCDSSIEGAIRYNSGGPALQFCALVNGPCTTIGQLCDDGSIFAGSTNMYVTDVNQSTGTAWKATTGSDDINPDSLTDGAANHANAVAITNLPAMNLCETLNRHGKVDWYLPARNELSVLRTNRAAINASAAQNFTTVDYWSSSEFNTSDGWRVVFSDGSQSASNKTNPNDVRCVRRGSGVTGMGYNWIDF